MLMTKADKFVEAVEELDISSNQLAQAIANYMSGDELKDFIGFLEDEGLIPESSESEDDE